METSTKFSGTELTLVTVNSIISKLFLIYPSSFSALASSAAPLLCLFTIAAGGIIALVLSYLYGSKRKDITKVLSNKFTAAAVTVLIILLLTPYLSLFVRTVAESIKISLLPTSPLFFITLIFVLAALLCANTGLKAIVRSHSFILPFTIAMTVILFVSSIQNFNFYNLFPVLGKGSKMVPYLFILCAYFSDFLILMLLLPFASEKAEPKKIIKNTFITSSAVLFAVVLLCTLVINPNSADTFFIPVYKAAQYVNYKSFTSRLEAVFTVGWLLSFITNTSLYIYIISMLAGRLSKLKSNRPIMWVLSVIILLLSLVPPDTATLSKWVNALSLPRLIVCLILPILLLLISRFGEVKHK